MTTIAYRSGVLAMDSRVTAEGVVYGAMVKGRATKNYLIAACGSMQDVAAFIDWAAAGFKPSEKKDYGLADREVEVEGIVIDRKLNAYTFETRLYPCLLESPYHVFGSGGSIALGAFAMGASAYKAVKIAGQFDTHTGGAIKLLSFRKKKVKAIAKTKQP